MRAIIIKILSSIFIKVEKFFSFIFNEDIFFFSRLINRKVFKTVKIGKRNMEFYVPNNTILWRIKTFFSKEPETINFIKQFYKKKKTIFWDIGSNIGLYSIYAALIHKNIQVISFEPSINNLRVLGTNISKNKLTNRIKIITNPLTNHSNYFSTMHESSVNEGSALSTFGQEFNFEGKKISSKLNYKLLGFSIDYFIEKKILEIPNYIKIDVDGLEHLILRGAKTILKSKKLEKISIELNENFLSQYKEVLYIMKKNNFKLMYSGKINTISFPKEAIEEKRSQKFKKTYNFHFIKNN